MRTRHLGVVLVPLLVVGSGCGDDDHAPRSTPTATMTRTATEAATAAATHTPSPVSTATAVLVATHTMPAATLTPTPTASPAPTSTPRPPALLVVGVARADDLVQVPDGVDDAGRPIYSRITGQGMMLFVEARRGSAPLNTQTYDPDGIAGGVEMLVSRPLGDGSAAVCDYDPPLIGGVPGIDPPVFSDEPVVRDAIDDLGCRFNDGTGQPAGRTAPNACTRDAGAIYGFTDPLAELQYCLPIARSWAFPPGDTVVAVRVRDQAGRVSAPSEIVVRVTGEVPFDCQQGLGERVFSPQAASSHLYVSPLGVDALEDVMVFQPLRICAGPDLGGGLHQVRLRQDALFGVALADGSVLCTHLSARGSDGIVDCDGGSAHDVLTRQLAASGLPPLTDTGLGLPAGTGAASLRAPVSMRLLPVGAALTDCVTAAFGFQFGGALTTTAGRAQVIDTSLMPLVESLSTGAPFSCESWRDGTDGALVLPFTALDTAAGDIAATLVLDD